MCKISRKKGRREERRKEGGLQLFFVGVYWLHRTKNRKNKSSPPDQPLYQNQNENTYTARA